MWLDENSENMVFEKQNRPVKTTATDEIYSNDLIQAVDQYESVITFANITADSRGMYFCTDRKKTLMTTVRLNIHLAVENFGNKQILQAGFDNVRPPAAPCSRFWSGRITESIIYTMSANLQSLQVVTPNQVFNLNKNIKSDHLDMTMEINALSENIGQATLTINRGMVYHNGDYQFIITYLSKNGTTFDESHRFTLDVYKGIETKTEQFAPQRIFTSLTIGRVYEIRMCLEPQKTFSNAWLGIKEQVPHEQGCDAKRVLLSNASDQCGVLEVVVLKNPSKIGVQIIMKLNKPCILSGTLDVSDSVPLVKLSPSLYISAVDEMDFGAPGETNALVSVPPGFRSGSSAFAGDNLTFLCLVPACEEIQSVGWCKEGMDCAWHITKTSETDDPLITYNYYRYSPYTFAYEMTFTPLTTKNNGNYRCVKSRFWSTQRHNSIFTGIAYLNLSVEEPRKPTFKDFKSYHVEERVLKRNGTLTLICHPSGRPKPEINWSWKSLNEPTMSDYRLVQIHELDDKTTLEVTQTGTYRCNVSNKFGANGRTFLVNDVVEHSSIRTDTANLTAVAIATPALVAILTFLALFLWYQYSKYGTNNHSFIELADSLESSSDTVPFDDTAPIKEQIKALRYNRKYEIARDGFVMTKTLVGEGQFGLVFKGNLKSTEGGDVDMLAIKVPRDIVNAQCCNILVEELTIMSNIRPHVNILSLAHACTSGLKERQLFVMTEFCGNGSLKNYLQKRILKFEGCSVNTAGQFVGAPGAVETLLSYAYQAANGMVHLAAQKIAHGDLALKNLLLTADRIVKIADFGLSRQHHSQSKDNVVPIFWAALELLADESAVWTEKSDVWSFGVVLWELFSLGQDPYLDHEKSTFRSWLSKEANRLGLPKIACDGMYPLMRDCWKADSKNRPTFGECFRTISQILERKYPSMNDSMILKLNKAWLKISPQQQPANDNESFASLPSITDADGCPSASDTSAMNDSGLLPRRTESGEKALVLSSNANSRPEDGNKNLDNAPQTSGTKPRDYEMARARICKN